MKFFILVLCLLLPFLLSYLFKHNNLEWYYILIIIITFGILVASYLVKNNEQNQYSWKSFIFKNKMKK
jgi:4-hydroxybenzoate polyprenyltransferase